MKSDDNFDDSLSDFNVNQTQTYNI